jgi:hypothetical protein
MASKEKTLFEVRKHNDFSVLCSDDEDTSVKISTGAASSESGTENRVVPDTFKIAVDNSEDGDGFETFTAVRKVKRGSLPKPAAPRPLVKPKEIITPKPENSIELYEFPATLKTTDLRKFLQDFDGHYRLKWINDTSCYVVFDDDSLGKF